MTWLRCGWWISDLKFEIQIQIQILKLSDLLTIRLLLLPVRSFFGFAV